MYLILIEVKLQKSALMGNDGCHKLISLPLDERNLDFLQLSVTDNVITRWKANDSKNSQE